MSVERTETEGVVLVSIIIVSWNRKDLLERCITSALDSIARFEHAFRQKEGGTCAEIIVVDNASWDGSPQMVRERFPQVRLIVNERNRGFAAANNQGMRIARGRYFLLLNNDAFLMPDALTKLVLWMECHHDVAAVTIKQLDERGVPMPPCATKFPTPFNIILKRVAELFDLARRFPNSRWVWRWLMLAPDTECEWDAAHITGACFFARRKAIEQVGDFDESFFLYLEETDLCLRLRRAGWRIFYTPIASFVHVCEGSSSLRTDREALYLRSYTHFFRKHYGTWAAALYRVEKRLFDWLKFAIVWLQRRTRTKPIYR